MRTRMILETHKKLKKCKAAIHFRAGEWKTPLDHCLRNQHGPETRHVGITYVWNDGEGIKK